MFVPHMGPFTHWIQNITMYSTSIQIIRIYIYIIYMQESWATSCEDLVPLKTAAVLRYQAEFLDAYLRAGGGMVFGAKCPWLIHGIPMYGIHTNGLFVINFCAMVYYAQKWIQLCPIMCHQTHKWILPWFVCDVSYSNIYFLDLNRVNKCWASLSHALMMMMMMVSFVAIAWRKIRTSLNAHSHWEDEADGCRWMLSRCLQNVFFSGTWDIWWYFTPINGIWFIGTWW